MHAAAGTCVGARVLCAFALESGSVSEGAVLSPAVLLLWRATVQVRKKSGDDYQKGPSMPSVLLRQWAAVTAWDVRQGWHGEGRQGRDRDGAR